MQCEVVEVKGPHVQLDDWSTDGAGRGVVTAAANYIEQWGEQRPSNHVRQHIDFADGVQDLCGDVFALARNDNVGSYGANLVEL